MEQGSISQRRENGRSVSERQRRRMWEWEGPVQRSVAALGDGTQELFLPIHENIKIKPCMSVSAHPFLQHNRKKSICVGDALVGVAAARCTRPQLPLRFSTFTFAQMSRERRLRSQISVLTATGVTGDVDRVGGGSKTAKYDLWRWETFDLQAFWGDVYRGSRIL